MGQAVKDLSVIGTTLVIDCTSKKAIDGEASQLGTAEYIQGTGTVVLEGTMMETDPAVWFPLVDLAQPPVAIPALTAADIGAPKFFRVSGLNRVRARTTVGGAGNLFGLGVD